MSLPDHGLAAPPETVDDDPPITHLMTADVVTVAPDTGLGAALRAMIHHHIRHLAVFDGPHCGGVVTETAVIRAIADDLVDASAGDLCVPFPHVRSTRRRSDAARRMQAEGVDAVLVVNGRETSDSTILGIVTATDIIRSVAEDTALRPATRR